MNHTIKIGRYQFKILMRDGDTTIKGSHTPLPNWWDGIIQINHVDYDGTPNFWTQWFGDHRATRHDKSWYKIRSKDYILIDDKVYDFDMSRYKYYTVLAMTTYIGSDDKTALAIRIEFYQ